MRDLPANNCHKSTHSEFLKRYYSKVMVLLQVIIDFSVFFISFFLGYHFYHLFGLSIGLGQGPQPLSLYLKLSLIGAFIFLFIFERFGLYTLQSSIMNMEEIKRIIKAVIVGAMLLFTVQFYYRDWTYSRLIISYSLIFLTILTIAERVIIYKLQQKSYVKGRGIHRVLIYGAGEIGQSLMRRLYQSPKLGMKAIGFIDDDPSKKNMVVNGMKGSPETSLKVLGDYDDLCRIIRDHEIGEVLIAMPSASPKKIYQIIKVCSDQKVKFSFVPNLFDLMIQNVQFEEIDGIPVLRLKESHTSYLYRILKRTFDIVFSCTMLLLFLPFFPIVAYLIEKDSEGPIFFRQKRVGKDGKIFNIYKLRTMRYDSPKYMKTPEDPNDPRITRIGRFLRRFSIDEIPQFINVLKGDMSVVGPRPEMPFVVESYNAAQMQRLKVRPGITGIWQISADRASPIHENIDYDTYYAENQSLLLDFIIIVYTIVSAIRGIGAV